MDCLVTSTAGVGAAATTTSADEADEAAASLNALLRCLAAMERTHPDAASILKSKLLSEQPCTTLLADWEALSASGELSSAPKPQAWQLKDGTQYTEGDLRVAVAGNELDAATALLEAGIDPDATGERLNGWSPLVFAAKEGHTEMAQLLLKHSANPLHTDRLGLTALDHASYWARDKMVALLQPLSGEQIAPPSVLLPEEKPYWLTTWSSHDHMTIICSAPEFSLSGFEVMNGLFDTCRWYPDRVSFGYDWGGSSSADRSDADPDRVVYSCCHSVACTCKPKGVMIIGSVNWSDPESVMGSQWYPKFCAKIKAAIGAMAQRAEIRVIEIVAIYGGPVTQLELRTLPKMICDGLADVKSKGVDISVAGSDEQTRIKLYLQPMSYTEYFRRFDDEWMSLYTPERAVVKAEGLFLRHGSETATALADRCAMALLYFDGVIPTLVAHGSDQHVTSEPLLELPMSGATVGVDEMDHLTVSVSATLYPGHEWAGKPLALRLADVQDAATAALEMDGWRAALITASCVEVTQSMLLEDARKLLRDGSHLLSVGGGVGTVVGYCDQEWEKQATDAQSSRKRRLQMLSRESDGTRSGSAADSDSEDASEKRLPAREGSPDFESRDPGETSSNSEDGWSCQLEGFVTSLDPLTVTMNLPDGIHQSTFVVQRNGAQRVWLLSEARQREVDTMIATRNEVLQKVKAGMVIEYLAGSHPKHPYAGKWVEAWVTSLEPEALLVKTSNDLQDGPTCEYGQGRFEVRLVSTERQKEIDEAPDEWWWDEPSPWTDGDQEQELQRRLEMLSW